jgi:O-glycosyl hydrolase
MQKVKISRPTIKFWATLKSDYAGYGVENNLPNWIYTGAGYNGGTYDPNLLDYTKYARFLADYLKHMNTNGVPITYMSVSKEWKQVFTATVEKNTIDALKTLLATAPYTGVPVPLFVGPAGWGVVGSTDFMADVATVGSSSLYAGFSTHDYDLPTATQWGSFTAAVATTGKPAWSDESASGANSPTSGAEPAISVPIAAYLNRCAYYRKGLKGELFFEQWSRGVNTETRSIYFTSGQAGVRLRGYYIMKHFANNAAGGSYLDSTKTGLPDVETMAFRQGKKITLWVINNSITDINNVTFNITGATMTSAAIVRTNWNATNAATGVVASATKNSNIQFTNSIESQQLIAYEFWIN